MDDVLKEVFDYYTNQLAKQSSANWGGNGGSSWGSGSGGSWGNGNGQPTTSQPFTGDIMDPDFVTQGNTGSSSAPNTSSGGNVAQSATPAHSDGKSPFSGVTSEMLKDAKSSDMDMDIFGRRHISESAVNEVKMGAKILYGNTPEITLIKAKSRVPMSDPNALEPIIRRAFTPDVVGMHWGVAVEFDRIYTLPIPLEEYERLVAEIAERTSSEGYTAELIVNILKSCSQAMYETMSNYLVAEFNKRSTRFIRSTTDLGQSITLANLDGILKFMDNPPKCKLTENPNAVTRFATLVQSFFRDIFHRNNAPQNSTTLTPENYTTYMHNDDVPMWDSKLKITKVGIPLLPIEDQKDWLSRINKRMTFLRRRETVFITNIMPAGFISSTAVGHVVKGWDSIGEVRVLLSLLRICAFDPESHVAGVVVAPMNRQGNIMLGNYALINPLENPTQVYLTRRLVL